MIQRRMKCAGALGERLAINCVVALAVATGPVSHAEVFRPAESPFNGKIAFSAKDSIPDWPRPVRAPAGAPNIIVILLDDTGFGATSTFGGPVQTPTLDRLAANGLRYNRFHVTAICSPTRAALLTGRNDHRAGFGTVTNAPRGYPGYNGIWTKSVVSVAEVLRRNGYSTAVFGKWHNTPEWEITPKGPFERWPTGLGFDYFYGFMSGVANQWEPELYRNTTAVEPPATPEQGYHLTTDIADEAIRWIRAHDSLAPEQPYFLYFAPGATHAPHHAPKEWIDRYRGRFDRGWNALREETFVRQKKLGVGPANAELTAWPAEIPRWDSFSADHRRLFARQMEVFAGFLAHTDYEIGRLLRVAQQSREGDNTLVFYIAGDNGGSSEAGPEGTEAELPLQQRLEHMDELGTVATPYNEYAAGWGLATNTPFQWSKQVASHFGSIRAPLVVSWPAHIKQTGGVRSQFTHVNDVAATIYDVTGIAFPEVVDGVAQKALDGTSFVYSFDDASAPSRHRLQLFENLGNRAIYQDGWFAGARHSLPWEWGGSDDFQHDRWELYHIDEDFTQARDLARRYPQKLAVLREVFDREAIANDVYPLGNLFNANEQSWRAVLSLVAGKRQFVYHSGTPRLSYAVTPDFFQSHRTAAKVVIPEGGAHGVIIANGGRHGGFALYVKDDHLVYENNFAGQCREVIASSIPVPRGAVTLGYQITYEKVQLEGQRRKNPARSAELRLFINGALVGQARLSRIGQRLGVPGSAGIGRAFGSPVSEAFRPPFSFTGQLDEVKIDLSWDMAPYQSAVTSESRY
jgi:arylsulfatase A-like enzyme